MMFVLNMQLASAVFTTTWVQYRAQKLLSYTVVLSSITKRGKKS